MYLTDSPVQPIRWPDLLTSDQPLPERYKRTTAKKQSFIRLLEVVESTSSSV